MKKFSLLCLILILALAMSPGAALADYYAANIIDNGDFEIADPCVANWQDPCVPEPNNWDMNIWTTGTSTLTYMSSGGVGDSNFVEVKRLGALDASMAVYNHHYIAEDVNYTFSVDLKDLYSEGGSPAVDIKIDFKDSGWNFIRTDSATVYPTTAGWATYTVDSNGLAPTGTRLMAVAIGSDALGTYDWVGIDNAVLIVKAPAPTFDDCQLAQFEWGMDFAWGDFNRDCAGDMRDLAILAEYWTRCNRTDCADYHYGY